MVPDARPARCVERTRDSARRASCVLRLPACRDLARARVVISARRAACRVRSHTPCAPAAAFTLSRRWPAAPAPTARRRQGRHGRDAGVHPVTARGSLIATLVMRTPARSESGTTRSHMHVLRHWNWTTAIAFAACLAWPGARPAAAASPDFNTVQWTALGCPNADLITHDSPSSADFAGNSAAGSEPAYYGFDSTFLYFRYRMAGNPANSGGFDQYSWTALMQVPSGDRFKYQYQLSLN